MEVLGNAQEEAAKRNGTMLKPEHNFNNIRKEMVRKCLVEAFLVHFLVGFAPSATACYFSWYRSLKRGRTLKAWLAAGSGWSFFVMCACAAHTSFSIRLSQAFSRFEIRRVQCDIRTCDPSMTHRITPRYKSLLRECHSLGKIGNKYFFFFFPVIVMSVMQVVGGIYLANMVEDDLEAMNDDEEATTIHYVPVWVFAHALQPSLSVLVFIHQYGLLNLAIERDLDQDLVELNIRLTFSEDALQHWLVEQLRCLEMLDGRAFVLAFDVIPTVEMSRKLASLMISLFLLILPYLLSVSDRMTKELI
jgi:hypothetical protein